MGEGNSILKLLSGSSYGGNIFHPSFLTCERDPMMSSLKRNLLGKTLEQLFSNPKILQKEIWHFL